ncbi:uncharacterized protein LOC136062262 [Quercus suber]|uniref:uncharacterized protein LOC136062262 n=1 Tax=Quercus suber TaxID=58331 RepID=UPI0032DEB88C
MTLDERFFNLALPRGFRFLRKFALFLFPKLKKFDNLISYEDSKGCFSVKSAYQESNPHLHPPNPSDVEWRKLWKLKGLERIKMFLWRVVVNALPTKENLMCRMDIEDTCCMLCDQECETSSHLFVKCLMAKALWFSVCRGLRSDELHLSTSADIIKLILKPPSTLYQAQNQWLVSLNMAFTLKEIWRTHNVVLHHKGEVDLQSSIQSIHSKVHECYLIFSKTEHNNPDPSTPKWSSPPPGTIKININAVISSSNVALAVVTRNSPGSMLNIWLE